MKSQLGSVLLENADSNSALVEWRLDKTASQIERFLSRYWNWATQVAIRTG